MNPTYFFGSDWNNFKFLRTENIRNLYRIILQYGFNFSGICRACAVIRFHRCQTSKMRHVPKLVRRVHQRAKFLTWHFGLKLAAERAPLKHKITHAINGIRAFLPHTKATNARNILEKLEYLLVVLRLLGVEGSAHLQRSGSKQAATSDGGSKQSPLFIGISK